MKKSKKVIDTIVNYKTGHYDTGKYRANKILKKCYRYHTQNNRKW